MGISPLASMKAKELKALCKAKGLKVSGAREILVQRLQTLGKVEDAGFLMPPIEEVEVPADIALLRVDAGKISINSQDEFDLAAKFLTERVNPRLKQLDLDESAIVDPVALALKRAKAIYKRDRDEALAVKAMINEAMIAFSAEQSRLKVESHAALEQVLIVKAEESELEKAARLSSEGDIAGAQAILARVTAGEVKPAITMPELIDRGVKASGGGVSFVKLPRYRVLDITKVNMEYLMVDHSKVMAAVREHGELANAVVGVGGIEVYYETSARSTSRDPGPGA